VLAVVCASDISVDDLLESIKLEITDLENRFKARDNEPTEKDGIIQDLRPQLQNMGSELESKVVQMQDIC
jgi:hypothetical protein